MALRSFFLSFFCVLTLLGGVSAQGATLRIGQHETFIRFVITSPQAVTHQIQGSSLSLTLKDTLVTDGLLKPSSVVSIKNDKEQDTTTITVAFKEPIQGVAPKVIGSRKIFDVTLGAASPPAVAEAEKTEEKTKATPPLPAPAPETSPVSEKSPIVEKPASAAQAPLTNENATVSLVAGDVRFSFPDAKPVGVAVFQRAGWQWIVLSHPVNLTSLEKEKNLQSLEIKSTYEGQIIRFQAPENRKATVWYEKGAWFVHLVPSPPETPGSLSESRDAAGLHLTIPGASPVFKVKDPVLGDFLWIVTTSDPAVAVKEARQFALLSLEPTTVGVALSSFQETLPLTQQGDTLTLALNGDRSLLSVTPEDTQALSKPSPPVSLSEKAAAPEKKEDEYLFNIRLWKRVPKNQFFLEKQSLERRIATVRPEEKPLARLTLARFFFAHDFYTESHAILSAMLADDPGLHASRPVKSLRGATLFMNRRYQEARQSLFESNTLDHPEGNLWMASAFAAEGLFKDAQPFLKNVTGIPETYTPAMTLALLEPLVAAWLENGDQDTANLYLNRGDSLDYTPGQRGRLDLLKANLLLASKKEEDARAAWTRLAKHPDHFVRTHADYALLDSEHRAGILTDDEAILGLERLRFAWRGDAFERNLLNRLVDLYIKKADYRQALQTLRYLEKQYPDTEDGKKARAQMQSLFVDLYLKDKADTMPPLTALALLDEFRFLTPDDETGDEMIRKLADRLVSVDLLDRAGDLLTHQVRERLNGEDKSRVGMRLAMIQLLNDKPEKAIEALNLSDYLYVPVALFEKRERLRAEAQVMQNQLEEALLTISDDTSEEANQIRAHSYWKQKNYTALVPLLESMIHLKPGAKTASEEEAHAILNYITALVLAKDDKALGEAFTRYAPVLNGTPWDEAFQALSNPDLMGNPKNVMGAFKDIGTLETLIDSYRKQLKTGKLSDVREEPEAGAIPKDPKAEKKPEEKTPEKTDPKVP